MVLKRKNSKNGESILAVFIRQLERQLQFYTITGEWVHRVEGSIFFVIPRMISASQIDPILSYLPAGPVPETSLDHLHAMDASAHRGAGATIIAELNQFHGLATEIIRQNGNKLNRAFDIMAHPTKSTSATLEEITMKVLGLANPSQLTHPALWATYRMIIKTLHFQVNLVKGRQFPRIHIISKDFAKEMVKVRTWVRDYQEQITADATGIESAFVDHDSINPLPDFIEKARRLVANSRQMRAVTKQGSVGPKSLKIDEDPIKVDDFTRDEQSIINFLVRWASFYFMRVDFTVVSIAPMILRATGMYPGFDLDISTVFVFLQELGVLAPWADHDRENPLLPLQSFFNARAKFSKFAIEEVKSPNAPLDINDSMASFRKDWAEMRVFCIDSDGARDIDDGVSLEEIQGDPLAFWVHVHVANPSAFIAPTSHIGQFAEELVATRYLIDICLPMLASNLSENHFSLAKDRPCITFSAKVTNDGDIAETKISHGIVRNVKHITPERLRRELASERTHASRRFTTIVVGKREEHLSLTSTCNPVVQDSETSPSAVPESLTSSDLKLLRKLSEIGAARRWKRIQAGAIVVPIRTKSEVSVTTSTSLDRGNLPAGQVHPPVPTAHRRSELDPFISLTTEITNFNQESHYADKSSTMVEDLMLLAGIVAASWCIQRNIPVAYRGTLRNPEPLESPELYKQKFLDPAVIEKGSAAFSTLMYYMRLIGPPVSSAIPMKNLTMGLPAYCRTTSPLRRYTDLLVHWQIEAAIRRESETGSSLIGSTDNKYLPFSFSRVEALAPRITHQEYLINNAGKTSASHWTTQLLFRAFYFQEATLPETFNVSILMLRRAYPPLYFGWPLEIGIGCDIPENEATRDQGRVFLGDVWEARISEINCYHRRILMEPIRLVSREETELTRQA